MCHATDVVTTGAIFKGQPESSDPKRSSKLLEHSVKSNTREAIDEDTQLFQKEEAHPFRSSRIDLDPLAPAKEVLSGIEKLISDGRAYRARLAKSLGLPDEEAENSTRGVVYRFQDPSPGDQDALTSLKEINDKFQALIYGISPDLSPPEEMPRTYNERLTAFDQRIDEIARQADEFRKRFDANQKRLDESEKILDANEREHDESRKRFDANQRRLDESQKILDAATRIVKRLETKLMEEYYRLNLQDSVKACELKRMFEEWIGNGGGQFASEEEPENVSESAKETPECLKEYEQSVDKFLQCLAQAQQANQRPEKSLSSSPRKNSSGIWGFISCPLKSVWRFLVRLFS